MKVCAPAGILLGRCTAATCPELLESPFAKQSKEHVRSNALGLRAVVKGCGAGESGLGFDDYLIAVGSEALARDLIAALDDVLKALDAIEEPDLEPALAADLASVRALHASLKRVTDKMKTEMVGVLDLELPKRVEGDND
jgi:hypothetical protein